MRRTGKIIAPIDTEAVIKQDLLYYNRALRLSEMESRSMHSRRSAATRTDVLLKLTTPTSQDPDATVNSAQRYSLQAQAKLRLTERPRSTKR